jgi:hypothetical protein
LDELDEKPNHSKSLEILKKKATRQKTHFLKHLIKTLCSMGSKCLALDASHM